jgi:predicted peptidase
MLASGALSINAQQQHSRFALNFFEHRGLKIPYRLFVPASHSPQATFPLVLYLHGAGERGNDGSDFVLKHGALEFEKRQSQYPCYILVPNARRNSNGRPIKKNLAITNLPIVPRSFKNSWCI